MKLAEALIERKNLKTRIDQIVERMKENVLVEEGDTPDEDIIELSKTYESMINRFETLVNRINKTNHEMMLDHMTIAEAIAKRDCYKLKISTHQKVKDAVTAKKRGYISQTKYTRMIDVAEYQKKIDELSRSYRELDTKIQSLNWTVDLL